MIHFVYAGTPNSGGLHAPLTITHYLYHFLADRVHTKFYSWDSTENIEPGPEDILLGHPHYDPKTVVQQAFQKQFRAKCLIFPFHHRRREDNWPFDPLVQKADKVFSICGPYWYDTMDRSPFAHWKSKVTRLDMAVDPTAFPYVKRSFNDNRKLVYIGSSSPNKNLPFLIKVMRAMPDVTLHWYGGDGRHPLARLPNVRTIGWTMMDRAAAERIASDCDIMVSVSDSDANPTTLLETMAWGLIPACTAESGYYNDPLFTPLYLNNLAATVRSLRTLLGMSSESLMQRSATGREAIVDKYTWLRFCTTVWDGIKEYVR